MNLQAKIDGLNEYIENLYPGGFEPLSLSDSITLNRKLGSTLGSKDSSSDIVPVPGLLTEEQAALATKTGHMPEIPIMLKSKRTSSPLRIAVNFLTNEVREVGYMW